MYHQLSNSGLSAQHRLSPLVHVIFLGSPLWEGSQPLLDSPCILLPMVAEQNVYKNTGSPLVPWDHSWCEGR
jgi:hypothetical protein